MLKLLIDECLSPELVDMAIAAGYMGSTCVRDRGLAGAKDWQLIEFAVGEDFTLVTHNSADFRGRIAGKPGGLHAKQSIHAGLICLNSVHVMHLNRQRDLFDLVLTELGTYSDLVNQAIEIFEAEDGSVTVVGYAIP